MDGRADQYSLGCVLFECLTGKVPFRRDSELAVLWAHVHDPPPRIGDHRPDLPAALDDVIGRALAKDPGDRYPSCEALVATAQAALAGAAPPARAPPHQPAARRPRRAGPRRAAGSAWPGVRRWCWPPRRACWRRWSWWRPSSWPGTTRARGPTAAGGAAPAANQAVRIDPATYHSAAAVAVGTDPAAVAGGGGAVWVASRQDGTVTVVDPATNRVQETLPASGSGPVGQGGPGLAFASGSLWVANTDQRQVVRVAPTPMPSHPGGREPGRRRRGPGRRVGGGPDPERGGLVARIDALTNQVGADSPAAPPTDRAGHHPDGQTVWVATPADQAVHRIDTARRRAVKRIPLQTPPTRWHSATTPSG